MANETLAELKYNGKKVIAEVARRDVKGRQLIASLDNISEYIVVDNSRPEDVTKTFYLKSIFDRLNIQSGYEVIFTIRQSSGSNDINNTIISVKTTTSDMFGLNSTFQSASASGGVAYVEVIVSVDSSARILDVTCIMNVDEKCRVMKSISSLVDKTLGDFTIKTLSPNSSSGYICSELLTQVYARD